MPVDTSPEAWEVFLDLHRRMTPEERLQRAFEYSAFVRTLAEGVLRHEHPHADEREIFLRSAGQRLGRELFQKVYGDELSDERPSGVRS
jgi:hypothetical protein